jgi:short subunit dehydrogenase-like uncharacterized protein
MITLFGATGYTGSQIAQQLEQSGVPYRLAGRSAQKLAALAQTLPSSPPTIVADVSQPKTLTALVKETRVLINCAGPFTDLGEPVAHHAAAAGVHYLDITNELAYVARVRQFDALAKASGAVLVPACAFEVAISDCMVAVLAREVSAALESVNVVYALPSGVVSYGTRFSGLRTFAVSWLGYRGGKLVRRLPGGPPRAGFIGQKPYAAVAFPSSEIITVPAHVQAQDVQAWLAFSPQWAGVVGALLPTVSVLLRTPLGWLTRQVFRYFTPPPPAMPPNAARFAIQVEAEANGQTFTRTVRGTEPYALTAHIAAYAAQKLLEPSFNRAGVLAPSQALEPEAFLAWLEKQSTNV